VENKTDEVRIAEAEGERTEGIERKEERV